MGPNYVGAVADQNIQGDNKRFFYALYRDDVGNLYYWKVDQYSDNAAYVVNNPGLAPNDFQEFEYGVDFFDGRLATDHSRPYSNLAFDQYRWDSQNINYYINNTQGNANNGQFVARINAPYTYPAGSQIS
jgi:hypothetical protein